MSSRADRQMSTHRKGEKSRLERLRKRFAHLDALCNEQESKLAYSHRLRDRETILLNAIDCLRRLIDQEKAAKRKKLEQTSSSESLYTGFPMVKVSL